MITLYGVTEDGQSVPVQVTEDGRLVVLNSGIQPGEDIDVGNVTASGDIEVAGSITASGNGTFGVEGAPSSDNGNIELIGSVGRLQINGRVPEAGESSSSFINLINNNAEKLSVSKAGSVTAAGNASFAGNKCGFTSEGELIFTSRGDRYRMIIQGNMLYPDPYPQTTDIVLPDE